MSQIVPGNQAWDNLNERIQNCRDCPRLTIWREAVAAQKKRAYRDWDYWGKPVPGFGDRDGRLLVVGLAPGAHGSNRTGRMFTGDASGNFLFPALYRAGFANQPASISVDDSLELKDVFISAVCRCVPPQNKPNPEEINNCRSFLLVEMNLLKKLQGIIVLGKIAFDQMTRIIPFSGPSVEKPVFKHGALFYSAGGNPWLLCSYHPSRQNTQTGKLNANMFDLIWSTATKLID